MYLKISKQTYQYNSKNSILFDLSDEYHLSKEEYFILYSFFVTFCMAGTHSQKKRTFKDYGWDTNRTINSKLAKALNSVLNLNRNANFIFPKEDNLRECFNITNLNDGEIRDLTYERFVVTPAKVYENKYFDLFSHIRNGLAHGKYKLRYSKNNVKMIIIQDNDSNNVTARIVLKIETLLNLVKTIDKNKIIQRSIK